MQSIKAGDIFIEWPQYGGWEGSKMEFNAPKIVNDESLFQNTIETKDGCRFLWEGWYWMVYHKRGDAFVHAGTLRDLNSDASPSELVSAWADVSE